MGFRERLDVPVLPSEKNLFQRKILLRLHKDGNISNEVIRQVEKEMDIDELKFQPLLPKEAE
jgi:hypothetical protein